MASVWIARQTGKHGFEKLVAIKTILPKYAAEPRFQQMFLDEARIASRIEHANVAQILDVGEQHDVTYLVMEYVDGDALSKLQPRGEEEGRADPARHRAARHGRRVRRAARRARAAGTTTGALLGVVHRDVSPQNVLVTTRGRGQAHRLRHRQGARPARGRHERRHAQGQGAVHGARAGARPAGRPPRRRLGRRRGALPPARAASRRSRRTTTSRRSSCSRAGARRCRCRRRAPRCVRDVVRAGARRTRPTPLRDGGASCSRRSRTRSSRPGLATHRLGGRGVPRGEIVGDRAEKRKEAIALGLKAAEEREKVRRRSCARTPSRPARRPGTARSRR